MSIETVLEELKRGDLSATDPMLIRFVDFAKAIPSEGAAEHVNENETLSDLI